MREEHLSSDDTFALISESAHFLQYVSNGNYYGRIKIGGKIIREVLRTDVWMAAKLRLTAFFEKASSSSPGIITASRK